MSTMMMALYAEVAVPLNAQVMSTAFCPPAVSGSTQMNETMTSLLALPAAGPQLSATPFMVTEVTVSPLFSTFRVKHAMMQFPAVALLANETELVADVPEV